MILLPIVKLVFILETVSFIHKKRIKPLFFPHPRTTMDKKIQKFFTKHHITENDIKYIIRRDGKTCICLDDGRIVETYTPLKTIITEMTPDHFINVNKGIALASDKIASIHDDQYMMQDGNHFKGRARMPMLYRFEQERRFNSPEMVNGSMDLINAFSVLDRIPIPFCVIELLYDNTGNSIDFRFRYANEAMADLQSLSREQLLNESFYSIFRNGDRKWLVAYADVALNGGSRIFRDYSPEINKDLTIYCYQPSEGYCACAFLEEPDEPKPGT